ncbi:MAG: alpha/beta fold hydrolase [Chloroflexota bacterium]
MVRAPERDLTAPLAADAQPRAREQSRARYPDTTGFVERDGVRVFYEAYGSGEPAILLLPTWSIVHSRFWKLQISYLARRNRVITFDGRGNGRSDRPPTTEAYAEAEFAADALAVMDATGTQRAVIVALSMGAQRGLILAADHADRVAGMVLIGPALALSPTTRPDDFHEPRESYDGWNKYSAAYWRRDYRHFVEFFFGQCFTEPHSTKQFEDCVHWALETDAETLIAGHDAPGVGDRAAILERAARVRCPVLVIHGTDDAIRPVRDGVEIAGATGGRLLLVEGGGHIPTARDPVKVNLAIRQFVDSLGSRT